MESEAKYRLGIDIGGTFTDFTLVNLQDNTTVGIKTPTVPAHPEEGVRDGLRILKRDFGLDASKVDFFVHGMTIGLNTLLQRKGSRIALFVTEGFRDILTMQRMRLPVPYDINSRLPVPLIPRNLVYGISERTLADGSEYRPLSTEKLKEAAKAAVSQGVEGIAICFLHSYKNSAHELTAKRWLSENYPCLKVCTSSELWPEIREYERACVAVINLYIQNNVEEYFQNLKKMLREEGIKAEPFITQSNGGIMNLESASLAPVKTLFSGPAAGVIGAIRAAKEGEEENLLTFDVGGTSTDISLVLKGEPTYTQCSQIAGFPVVMPAIDIVSIGAGGGSVGWLDPGGLLKMGPESAGSDPGPACYGKSMIPTLTDAFLICGYLNAERFAAGRMKLEKQRSRKAAAPLAEAYQVDVRTLADQMIQVAVANMYAELSNVMERKGFDPRELSIVAYGGGGPLTANLLAEEIHAKNVFVPYRPGTLCAMGSLFADFVYDAVIPKHFLVSEITADTLDAELKLLRKEAEEWLQSQNTEIVRGAEPEVAYLADARYRGQAYEIQIPITEEMLQKGMEAVAAAFHRRHQQQYGHYEPEAGIELVNLRARIIAKTPELPPIVIASRNSGALKAGETRKVFIRGRQWNAEVYQRAEILAGDVIAGPAVVEQDDCTVLILDGWHGECDTHGNIRILRDERQVWQDE